MTAHEWFERLALEDKVGQLLVPRPPSLEVSPTAFVDSFGAGGLIVYRDIYQNPPQMAEYIAKAQRAALARSGIPLLICCDHEGGHIRFMRTVATGVPSNMALGAAGDPSIAADAARLLAEELLAVGVNWTLGPVVDVNNNPLNPVIGTRAYSDDPAVVSAFGCAAIGAYQSAGLLACAKHFPGHGDTDIDSHVGLPRLAFSRERLEQIELAPFRAAVEAGVASVMTAHMLVDALDPEWIGTLSAPILTDLLRGEMGHQGIIVTDALEMAGVADILPEPEAAIEAVRAGADVLLTGRSVAGNEEVFRALLQAVRSGRVPSARFEDAVRHVLEAKTRFVDTAVPDPAVAGREVGSDAHRQAAVDLARRTITVVRQAAGHLPLPRDLGRRLVVLSPLGSRRTKMEQWTYGQSALGQEIAARAPGAVEIAVAYPLEDGERERVGSAVVGAAAIVVGVLNAQLDEDQVEFVTWLAQQAPDARLIVVGLRTPYDILGLPWLPTYVCAYTSVEPSMVALAEVLFGEQPARGKLPVRLDQRQGDA